MQASARVIGPLLLGGAIILVPAPEGLAPAAWHYFALFVTAIWLLLSGNTAAAIGMAGVTAAAALGLVRETPRASAEWALSGFGNTIVWLIFAAFMFTVGYAQTGLGRRIALHLVRRLGGRTLGLGYAVALADLAFAPFTPSATARSALTSPLRSPTAITRPWRMFQFELLALARLPLPSPNKTRTAPPLKPKPTKTS